VDLIDRLFGHSRWTTNRYLEYSLPLTDEQLDREFDIGNQTVRRTFIHIIRAMDGWAGRLSGTSPEPHPPATSSVPELIDFHNAAFDRFEAASKAVLATGNLNGIFTDHHNFPQSYGGTILQVMVHNVEHRSDIRHMLVRLGVQNLIDGDLQEWEHFSGLITRWGGTYPPDFTPPWETDTPGR
jgi:uncharacterized damage-inducible protein DinB